MVMLRLWLNTEGNRATGNALEKALKNCDREDIVRECIFNVELVTDESEQNNARSAIIRSGAAASTEPGTTTTRGRTPTIPEADDEGALPTEEAGFESFKEELTGLDAQHSSTLKRDSEMVTTTMTTTTTTTSSSSSEQKEKHASAEESFTEKSATIVHQERTSEPPTLL